MYTVKISFKPVKPSEIELLYDLVSNLLGAWRRNGQILDGEYPTAQVKNGLEVYLIAPDERSLSEEFNNRWVTEYLTKIRKLKVKPNITVLGEEPESAPVCDCARITKYILFTHFLTSESPIKCVKCFGVVPLYTIPKTDADEYPDILIWQSDYQSCDRLQMHCGAGERFGTGQMSRYNSKLTGAGLKVCRSIERVTGKKVFYYIYRSGAKSFEAELQRKCLGCGGDWLLKKPLHGEFDFMCKKCHLLSNISWDLRT